MTKEAITYLHMIVSRHPSITSFSTKDNCGRIPRSFVVGAEKRMDLNRHNENQRRLTLRQRCWLVIIDPVSRTGDADLDFSELPYYTFLRGCREFNERFYIRRLDLIRFKEPPPALRKIVNRCKSNAHRDDVRKFEHLVSQPRTRKRVDRYSPQVY
jgi:hypothetical protein